MPTFFDGRTQHHECSLSLHSAYPFFSARRALRKARRKTRKQNRPGQYKKQHGGTKNQIPSLFSLHCGFWFWHGVGKGNGLPSFHPFASRRCLFRCCGICGNRFVRGLPLVCVRVLVFRRLACLDICPNGHGRQGTGRGFRHGRDFSDCSAVCDAVDGRAKRLVCLPVFPLAISGEEHLIAQRKEGGKSYGQK